MKTLLIAAAFCVGALSVPMTASAGGSTKVKGCDKEAMSVECIQNLLKSDKVFGDIASGKKPNVKLPVSPDSLPLGDLAKLLSR
jgi:hypothetical protein